MANESIRLDTRSVQQTIKKLQKYGRAVQSDIGKLVETTAVKIELAAKKRVRVKDNNLRPSIHRTIKKKSLSATVGTNVHYAPYVEFGTGNLVSVPEGLGTYAMQFKGKGIKQINLRARPFLFNSANENRKAYKNGVKKILKKVKR
jgi:HK97 gp10 family phage protein